MNGPPQPPVTNRLFKRALSRTFWTLLGRRNMVRFARFLLTEGRLDAATSIGDNGEAMVQRTVLEAGLDKPVVIFDVGAYRGWWTDSLLRTAGADLSGFEVHCFEPSQRNHGILLEKIATFPDSARVQPVKLGMSDEPGELELFVSGRGGANSVYRHSTTPEDFVMERIQLTSIDHYCEEHGIDAVSLVKVDAEGHDLRVLRGARRMLGERRIPVIQFEYNHRWITARAYLKDAMEYLQDLGYAVGKVTPRGIEFYSDWHWELETNWEANFIGCLPEWKPRFPQIPWWRES